VKVAVDRTRPDGTSFGYPSGHTSTAFATAGVITHYYGYKYGIAAYTLATYIGLSRIQANKHYLSDVVAGAVLGSYVSLKLTRKDNHNKSLSASPIVSGNTGGMLLTLRF
jgi:membrane-associated phospholipid phosphatase